MSFQLMSSGMRSIQPVTERYWKLRRQRQNENGDWLYTAEELTEKLSDAKAHTKHLESLAPEESF